MRIQVNNSKVVNLEQSTAAIGETPDWYGTANQVMLSDGPKASYGRFVVDCKDYETNWPEDDAFSIIMQQEICGTLKTVNLTGYYTVGTQEVFRQTAPSQLVTIADPRYYLRHRQTNRTWNVGSETSKTWTDVLTDLSEDLGNEYTSSLAYVNFPSLAPCNLKYEGWNTLEALQDLCSRTGHVLIYDPFLGSLAMKDMQGPQPEIAALVQQGKYHRVYSPAETTTADEFDVVQVNYDYVSGKPAGKSSDGGEKAEMAWATCLADCQGVGPKLQNEIDMLTKVWQDYSFRLSHRDTIEFLGPETITPGEEVANVYWQIKNGQIFTTVDLDAPTAPHTKRQKTNDQLIKFKLSAEIDGCGQAAGELLECGCTPDATVTLHDKTGLAKLYKDIEAGWMGYCKQSPDNQEEYDIVSLGMGCCGDDPEPPPPCPPDTIVWYETDVRCVTTTGATAPGELHQYKRQNEYYFDGYCPTVTQGAWFYDRRIACKIDCCEAPEPCEHCDCCVEITLPFERVILYKKTTYSAGEFTNYKVCQPEPCYYYIREDDFCPEFEDGLPEQLQCDSTWKAYWLLTLDCADSGDNALPDTWRFTAERFCYNQLWTPNVPPATELPAAWPSAGVSLGTGTLDLSMLCSETTVTGTLECRLNYGGIDYICENEVTLTVVDCPEICSTSPGGDPPCANFDPACAYDPPDPDPDTGDP